MTSPITTSTVARRLGVCEATVRRMDAQLAPTKTPTGLRLYDPEVVDRVASELAAAKAAKLAATNPTAVTP